MRSVFVVSIELGVVALVCGLLSLLARLALRLIPTPYAEWRGGAAVRVRARACRSLLGALVPQMVGNGKREIREQTPPRSPAPDVPQGSGSVPQGRRLARAPPCSCSPPTLRLDTKPLSSSCFKCGAIAGSDILSGRASSLTLAGPRESRAMMARRAGSASAEYMRSRAASERFTTI